LCLKNLPKTNGYVEFGYVTQEAEQCPVKLFQRGQTYLTGDCPVKFCYTYPGRGFYPGR